MAEESTKVLTDTIEPTIAPAPEEPLFTRPVLVNGPLPDVEYPVKIVYCGNCGLPPEFCMYYPTEKEKCMTWLEGNIPDLFERLSLDAKGTSSKGGPKVVSAGDSKDGPDSQNGETGGKSQKRGGKANKPPKKKESEKRICLSRSNRGKKKYVTLITGLKTSYDIDLKEAAKVFASKFACGSSVTGADEIVIQGDVKDDLYDYILEKWTFIDEDAVEDLGEVKR